ncbi:MAG: GntR family transcriptional regulator [Acetobacteraceae bacterium]
MTVRPVSLVTQVYEVLYRRIVEQRLAAGESLIISRIAGELGISATPVREALARLHAEGLVTLADNRGYHVTSVPSPETIRQWMDARLVIEVNTLPLAAPRLRPRDFASLQSLNDRIRAGRFGGRSAPAERLVRARGFADLNLAFHSALIAAAGNPYLLRAWQNVAVVAQFSRMHLGRGVLYQAAIAAEHQRIIDALREGDTPAAVNALRTHIIDSLARDGAAAGGKAPLRADTPPPVHSPSAAASVAGVP